MYVMSVEEEVEEERWLGGGDRWHCILDGCEVEARHFEVHVSKTPLPHQQLFFL